MSNVNGFEQTDGIIDLSIFDHILDAKSVQGSLLVDLHTLLVLLDDLLPYLGLLGERLGHIEVPFIQQKVIDMDIHIFGLLLLAHLDPFLPADHRRLLLGNERLGGLTLPLFSIPRVSQHV